MAIFLWPASDIPAQDDSPALPALTAEQAAEQQALEKERIEIDRLLEEVRREAKGFAEKLAALEVTEVTETMLEQARVQVDDLELLAERQKVDLGVGERRITELRETIQDLQSREQLLQNPARWDEVNHAGRLERLERTRQALAKQEINLVLQEQRFENLNKRLGITEQRLDLAKQRRLRIEGLYSLRREQDRRAIQGEVASRLQAERRGHLDQVMQLTERLEQGGDALSKDQRRVLSIERETYEELARYTELSVVLVAAESDLTLIEGLIDAEEISVQELQTGREQLKELAQGLEAFLDLAIRKEEILYRRRQVVEQRKKLGTEAQEVIAAEEQFVATVMTEIEERRTAIETHLNRIEGIRERLDTRYKDRLAHELLAHSQLPRTGEELGKLLVGIADAHRVLFYQLWLSLKSAMDSMVNATALRWASLVALEVVLLVLLVVARHMLGRALRTIKLAEKTPFFSEVSRILLTLPWNNLGIIGFVAAVLVAFWVFPVAPPGEEIITTLLLLGLGIRILIDLAWLLLADPDLPPQRHRPRLYRVWFVVLLLGGVLTAFSVASHLSGLPTDVIHAVDRMVMLYLLLMTVPVLQVRKLLIQQLVRYYGRRYWLYGLRFVSLILPVSLLVTSVVGLLGYLNLGWAIAGYVMVFAEVLAGWLVGQGLLNDLAAWLKNRAFERSARDWSAIREIVDSSHRVFSILLFLTAGLVLARAYGIGEGTNLAEAGKMLVLAIVAILAVHEIVYLVGGHMTQSSEGFLGNALVKNSRTPLAFVLPIAMAQIMLPTFDLPEEIVVRGEQILVIAQIMAVTWLLIGLVSMLDNFAEHRYRVDFKSNLGARRARTQMRVLRQSLHVVVILIGVGAILMTFPAIRQLGAGLLASAGAAGLIIGIAAKPLFENLIAGIQIGLTQPIRLDDVVIVENEWGTIEEINATYVVVRIWDQRRLVVPLKYFNEQPFQSWTRQSSELLGTAFIHTDYTFPVEEGRKALKRILDESGLWDGKGWALQVTDAKEHTVELRALMSAPDAPTAWELRCHVREKFIEFIQQHYPEALPKTRAVLTPHDAEETRETIPLLMQQAGRSPA